MPDEKRGRGAPSKFDDRFPAMAAKLAADGKTNDEIAEFFNVARSTFYLWLKKSDELSDALKNAKESVDDMVEASLFRRAVGYTAPDTKVFCHEGHVTEHTIMKNYAPDPVSCIFWLKNRRPEQWRDSGSNVPDVNINLNYNLEETPDGEQPAEESEQ